MNRRSGIKTLLIISAGAAFLPGCLQEKKKSSLPLKNITIDDKEEELLAQLGDTIIPTTDTPGARDVSAHLFAIMMMDDCFPPEGQDKFKKGLTAFDELSKKKFGNSFTKSTPAEKAQLIQFIQDKNGISEDVDFFYSTTKRLTIQAFISSEYYLTKVQVYKLAPGRFYGCVPVTKAS